MDHFFTSRSDAGALNAIFRHVEGYDGLPDVHSGFGTRSSPARQRHPDRRAARACTRSGDHLVTT